MFFHNLKTISNYVSFFFLSLSSILWSTRAPIPVHLDKCFHFLQIFFKRQLCIFWTCPVTVLAFIEIIEETIVYFFTLPRYYFGINSCWFSRILLSDKISKLVFIVNHFSMKYLVLFHAYVTIDFHSDIWYFKLYAMVSKFGLIL
jgi:hypothetical protein